MAKYHYGAVFKNMRKRDGVNDPDMMGFLDLPNGRASIAAWIVGQEMNLTLRPWKSRSRVFSHGLLKVNDTQLFSTSPNLLGNIFWSSCEWSVAGWVHKDKKGKNYIKLSAAFKSYQGERKEIDSFVNNAA